MPTSTTSGTVSLTDLRSQLQGRALGPGDSGYDEARTIMAGGFDPKPAVIVRPTVDADVARTIALARETGLPLAVRSGGHSGAGHGTADGGIVLDLRDMKTIEIDV
ncbi:MAG: FAD-binding protein, partial [Pseudonocardiaceae bacterium]